MEKILFSLVWFSFCLTFSYRQYFHRSQKGKSVCDACYRELKWWMKIPILGYLLNQGHCPYCKKPIPFFWFGMDVYSLLIGVAWQKSKMTLLPFMSLSFLFIKMGLEDAYSERMRTFDLGLSSVLMALFYFQGIKGKWLISILCILISPYLKNPWIGEGDIWLFGIFFIGFTIGIGSFVARDCQWLGIIIFYGHEEKKNSLWPMVVSSGLVTTNYWGTMLK